MSGRGQSLVEFALVLPLLLFLFLGFAEAAFLVATRHAQQTGADVLAAAAAERIASEGATWQTGWQPLVAEEADRAGCAAATVGVEFPDETSGPGDRVVLTWSCPYEPVATRGLWPGLVIRLSSAAVIRS